MEIFVFNVGQRIERFISSSILVSSHINNKRKAGSVILAYNMAHTYCRVHLNADKEKDMYFVVRLNHQTLSYFSKNFSRGVLYSQLVAKVDFQFRRLFHLAYTNGWITKGKWAKCLTTETNVCLQNRNLLPMNRLFHNITDFCCCLKKAQI